MDHASNLRLTLIRIFIAKSLIRGVTKYLSWNVSEIRDSPACLLFLRRLQYVWYSLTTKHTHYIALLSSGLTHWVSDTEQTRRLSLVCSNSPKRGQDSVQASPILPLMPEPVALVFSYHSTVHWTPLEFPIHSEAVCTPMCLILYICGTSGFHYLDGWVNSTCTVICLETF